MMSRKANNLKKRLRIQQERHASQNTTLQSRLKAEVVALGKEVATIERDKRVIAHERQQLLKLMHIAVRIDTYPDRFDVYHAGVDFRPDAIRYGTYRALGEMGGQAIDIDRIAMHISEQVASYMCKAIHDKFTRSPLQ